MIAIIDYGMGNLRSVAKALEAAGAEKATVTSEVSAIRKSEKIVLPGVGAMQEAMQELQRLRLVEVIKESAFKKPFLGICLGLQLLFSESEEGGKIEGLGIVKGTVKRFSDTLKVPHMGWNQVQRRMRDEGRGTKDEGRGTRDEGRRTRDEGRGTRDEGRGAQKCRILENIPDNSYFYFCHSYYVVPEDTSLIATTTEYGVDFVSSICKDTLFACQFHPEKSQSMGLKLLENFVRL